MGQGRARQGRAGQRTVGQDHSQMERVSRILVCRKVLLRLMEDFVVQVSPT